MEIFKIRAKEAEDMEEDKTPCEDGAIFEERQDPCETVVEPKLEVEKDACLSCFGWNGVKIEKWLIKSARIWYMIASFGWFLFGAFTFAPVIFISQKVDVLFHNKKRSLICAIVIYSIIISLIAGAIIVL